MHRRHLPKHTRKLARSVCRTKIHKKREKKGKQPSSKNVYNNVTSLVCANYQPEVRDFFRASTTSTLGDGRRFWANHWLDGRLTPNSLRLSPLSPLGGIGVIVWSAMAFRTRPRFRTSTAPSGLWPRWSNVDICRHIQQVVLAPHPNMIRWCWTDNVIYSMKSCYLALFHGSTIASHWRQTWKNWAPLNGKFFLWLASQDRY